MNREDIIKHFGIDPENVGIRPREWWIVEEIDDDEKRMGVSIGDLCIMTRDGEYLDPDACKAVGYIGSYVDETDHTYRYYYFRQYEKGEEER